MKTRTFQFAEYGQPTDVLKLAEQELPEPGPGQALVKIKAVMQICLLTVQLPADCISTNTMYLSCLPGENAPPPHDIGDSLSLVLILAVG